jgi:hypothetical protein
MGWLRAAVGGFLIVAPGVTLRLSHREAPTAASRLLLRTIGIRDLVIGVGTVMAGNADDEDDLRRWTSVGLMSDSSDLVASIASRRAIGNVESLGAASAALVFVVGDVLARRSLRGAPTP